MSARWIRRALALLALLSAGSCSSVQPLLEPRGPAAEKLADLGGFVLWTVTIVAVLMAVLVLIVSLRRRGSLQTHDAFDARGGQMWILIGGFAIPAVVLAVLFIAGLRAMNAFPIARGNSADPRLVITGHQWWWQVDYVGGPLDRRVTTANEIHIPVGRPVEISLRSADVIHSFWVPQLHGKVDLVPGQVNAIRLQADQPGRYRGECAEYCGEQHAHMVLWITADSPSEYQKWLTNEGADAVAPVDSVAALGQQVFARNACALCHTVRGTEAQGRVGPDLTHIGSRPTIAAGSYRNDTAHLSAWVTHAQSLKPGAQMPDVVAFTGAELHALVSYLQGLR